MIRFECVGCSQLFEVEDEREGKRGKCVKCGTHFIVPGVEGTKPGEGAIHLETSNNRLNDLLAAFSKDYQSKILSADVRKKDQQEYVLMTLETDPDTGRKQNLGIYPLKGVNSVVKGVVPKYPYKTTNALMIQTFVGEVSSYKETLLAFRSASSIAHAGLSLDENHVLVLKRTIPDLDHFDPSEFPLILLEMAVCADKLEEAVFGVDKF